MTACKLGVCLVAMAVASTNVAQARSCATPAEVSAVRVSAVQQELTDAALTCGPAAVEQFNRFQKTFRRALRESDARMLGMFKRMHGARKGLAAYDAYKTRAINHAEQRRTRPGAHDGFCEAASQVFAAALAPGKPSLVSLVAGMDVKEELPVAACEVRVAATHETILPTPRPALPGDHAPAVAAGTKAPQLRGQR